MPIALTEKMMDEMSVEEFDNFMDNDIYPERLNHLLEETEELQDNDENDTEVEDTVEQDTPEEDSEEEDSSVSSDEDTEQEEEKESSEEDEKSSVKPEETVAINYEEVYKTIFQPLKASKKEFVPQTPEEVRKLMQQGIDYTRKTQEIASKRKLIETLEFNGVSEQDLNFLIDVHKKNPEAIKQLLRDNSIDPMELDLEEGTYTPSNNIASETYVEAKEVIDYVKSSPHFDKVQDIITNVWDKASTELIKQQPTLLAQVLGEVEMGRFDQVQDYIEREKILGINTHIPDINRYVQLVSTGGKFAAVENTNVNIPNNTPVTRVPQGNKAGARPTKNTSSIKNQGKRQLTPLEMDKLKDEEFEAYFNQQE